MNRYYLSVFVVSISVLALFLGSLDKESMNEEISMNEKTPLIKENILSPDEVWEEQQQKVKRVSKKDNAVATVQQVNLPPKAITTTSKIPDPDKIWEQQHSNNREFDLPATIPTMEVVSVEQLESESQYKTNLIEDKSIFDDDLVENGIANEELPAIESTSMEVVPFELKQLEALEKERKTSNEEYQEPLLDPKTGLSDKELMQAQDTELPIESDFPVN